MKPKQYKLLKETPVNNVGDIFTWNEERNRYECPNVATDTIEWYQRMTVEERTDFFQLVEEKEFTASEMIEFANYSMAQFSSFHASIVNPARHFQEWLTQRNNGK